MSITKIFPFTTPANYTYDTNQITVVGDAKLTDQTPTGSTSWATYTTDINLNGGGGILTGVGTGGASIAGNKLDLTGSTLQYVDYPSAGNCPMLNQGCIKIKYTPNYSNAPATTQCIIVVGDVGSNNDAVAIQHVSTGELRIAILDGAGTPIIAVNLAAWNPVATTEYEIELDFDITLGETRLFVDGVQFGATQAATGTKTATEQIRVGTNSAASLTADFSIADIVFFDTVQHITDYTAGYVLPETLYLTTDPVITTIDIIKAGGLASFVETSTKSGTDEIKYILIKDGTKYYYNVGWVVSDGSYTQANTAAEIETNKTTFTADATDLTIDILLHSGDGSTSPIVHSLDVGYNFATPTGETVNTTILWWDAKQNDGEDDTTTATISLTNGVVKYLTRTIVTQELLTITPANGAYSVAIVDTENMELDPEGNEQTYTLTIESKTYTLRIPQLDSVNLYDAGIIV